MQNDRIHRRQFLARGMTSALALSVSGLTLGGTTWAPTGVRAQAEPLRVHNLALAVQPKQHIVCQSVQDVQRAVQDLTAQGRAFSVYSSGHCFAGFSLHKQAVIDVSGMAQIALDGDLVTAGPGTQIGALMRVLGAEGRTLPAGFCQTVALGGHLGCGGIGHLSRAQGLLADHLVAAQVVTATGEVLRVSEAEHPDLFWALRGGGPGSFGIVTEMQFRTIPDFQATHLSALVRLPLAQAARVAAAWQTWSMQLPDSVSTTFDANSPDFQNIQMNVTVIAHEDSPELRAAIVRFMGAVPWIEAPRVTQGAYSDLADVFWPRDYYPTVSMAYASAFSRNTTALDVWQDVFEQMTKQQAPRLQLFIERLGGEMSSVAPEATGFVHRDADFIWQFEGTLNRLHGQAAQALAVDRFAQGVRAADGQGAYAGYPNPRDTDWETAYWGLNYPRLQRVKRRYDPANVFRHSQSIRLA